MIFSVSCWESAQVGGMPRLVHSRSCLPAFVRNEAHYLTLAAACDLHLAMSLVAKMREYGLATPMEALVLQPTSVMQRRQRRRRQSQVSS